MMRSPVNEADIALAEAERDALRMTDVVRTMLRRLQGLFDGDERQAIDAIKELDEELDELNERIEMRLGMLIGRKHPKQHVTRCSALLELAGHVEHVADVVNRLLVRGSSRSLRHGVRLSPAARAGMAELLLLLQSHLKLCAISFAHAGPNALKYLAKQRDALRRVEREIARENLRREAAGPNAPARPFAFALGCLRRINDRLAVIPGLATSGWRLSLSIANGRHTKAL